MSATHITTTTIQQRQPARRALHLAAGQLVAHAVLRAMALISVIPLILKA